MEKKLDIIITGDIGTTITTRVPSLIPRYSKSSLGAAGFYSFRLGGLGVGVWGLGFRISGCGV